MCRTAGSVEAKTTSSLGDGAVSVTKLSKRVDKPERVQLRFSGLIKDRHHKYTADVICGVSLLAAEILTIVAAGLGALLGARLFPAVDIDQGFSSMSSARLWAVAPELSIV